MSSRRTTLSPNEQELVLVELRKIRQELGSQVAVAEALDVTQQTVSRALSGFPAGIGLAERVGRFRKRPDVEVFLGRKADRRVEYERGAGKTALWGDLPWWPEMEAQARKKYARLAIPERAWVGARQLAGARPPTPGPEAVKAAAQFWLEYCDDTEPSRK